MPLGNPLVDPRLLASLSPNFWVSRCSIYDTDDAPNAVGEIVRTKQGSPLTGYAGLHCNISQVLGRGADFSEMRQANTTYVAQQYECQLDGHYEGIVEDMIAVVDGVDYDIRGVKQASVGSHTVLMLERIR